MRDSMWTDDFLLIWVEMTNFAKINKIIPHYEWDLVENFMYYIPSKIWIDKQKTTYQAIWNDKESQIEIWLTFKEDQKISIGNEFFILEENERLIVCRSIKFNERTFTKLLSDIGFRTEVLITSKDRWYVLSMVQPTRFSV